LFGTEEEIESASELGMRQLQSQESELLRLEPDFGSFSSSGSQMVYAVSSQAISLGILRIVPVKAPLRIVRQTYATAVLKKFALPNRCRTSFFMPISKIELEKNAICHHCFAHQPEYNSGSPRTITV